MGAILNYEPTALTAELWALVRRIVTYLCIIGKRVFSLNHVKFVGSDVLSPAKYDIMTVVVYMLLSLLFRAGTTSANEDIQEQRQNDSIDS